MKRLARASVRGPGAEAAFVALLPPLLFLAYATSRINQNAFTDAFVYTGYINNFGDLVDRYGLTYYAVRFGLILPGLTLTRLLGGAAGYFATVYVLYLVAGVPLYLALRKHFGVAGACAGYATFVSSVWVARTMLWQYVDGAVVAYLVGGISMILLDPARRAIACVVAGALFGLAAHSNAFAAAYVALAAVPYGVLNAGRIRSRIVADVIGVAVGMAAVTALGALAYGLLTGHWNILRPTLRMIALAGELKRYRPSDPAWFLSASWLLYPPFVLAAAGALSLWRQARSRVLAAAAAYVALCGLFLVAWQSLGAALGLYFYSSMLAASVMTLAGVISATIVAAARPSRLTCALLVVAIVLVPPAWRALDAVALATGRVALLVVVAGAVVLLARAAASRPAAIAACLLFVAVSHLLFVAGFTRDASLGADPGYWRVFGAPRANEWETYQIALQLMAAMPKLADRGEPLRFWYPAEANDRGSAFRLNAIQSTYLWAYSRLHGNDTRRGAPEVGDRERGLLTGGESFQLALLATSPAQLEASRSALQRLGVRFSTDFTRSLCAGRVCALVELLEIRPAAGYWLSGGAGVRGRTVFAADARALATGLERNLYGWFGKDRVLTFRDDRLVFAPTSRDDHLATKFFGVGDRPDGEAVGVRVIAQMPEAPAGHCRLALQSQAFATLASVACAGLDGAGPGPRVFETALPAGVKNLRVLLASADGRRTDLPSAMQVELIPARLPASR